MRIRSIAAAVLVAAGLSVGLTGAAGAGEPDDPDVTIVTCENIDGARRALTEEEVVRLPPLPPPPRLERAPAERAEPGSRADGVPPGDVRFVPAEPGEPGRVVCSMAVRPHD